MKIMTQTERAWLEYAWRVVACPDDHLARCIANGAAVPGEGRVDGNDLRWPGYLGREYRSGRSVLCVGAVHRESSVKNEDASEIIANINRRLISSARTWLAYGRSKNSDAAYLEEVRDAYEKGLPAWPRYQRHFRRLVQDHLGLSVPEIAWTNLAKCRVPIDRGAAQRQAEQRLTRLCQAEFAPLRNLVDAIRPTAVLVAVLHAGRNGDIVDWGAIGWKPLVYSWQGQSGHDRHNTDPSARRLEEWAPEMAEQIRLRWNANEQG